MRVWIAVAAIASSALVSGPATAGFRDDMGGCRTHAQSNPDAAIPKCRAAIGMAERNRAILNDQGLSDLWFSLALAFEAKKDFRSAIGALDGAISVYSGDTRFAYRRARMWQGLGEWAKAVADHDRAIRQLLNPRPGYSTNKGMLFHSYMDRGAAQEKLGQRELARDDYVRALALFPGNVQATAARDALNVQPTPMAVDATPAPAAPRIGIAPKMPKRAALIIGNSQYLYTNGLPNAVNDAADVAAALKAQGYSIYGYPHVNMHREDMFTALEAFQRAAANADIALVWYAGHGQQMSDPGEPTRNWLFPVDFKGGTDLDRGAVPLSKLLSAAQPAKALRVVVVDACRNTTLQSNARAPRGLRPEQRANMVIVYSTSAGSLAEDGDPATRNSPFASAFLETFRAYGAVDVRQFFGGVSEGVQRRTAKSENPQQPELMSNLNTLETLALAP
jgi:tetratricopeptide (TPR) repeat protein